MLDKLKQIKLENLKNNQICLFAFFHLKRLYLFFWFLTHFYNAIYFFNIICYQLVTNDIWKKYRFNRD